MHILKMPIKALILPKRNVRIHTESQIQEFVRSIKMFGQIRPVVVDEDNVILAGNGLVEALTRAGITEAAVYKIENLTPNQKKKLMIADNKIFSLGIENLETLNSFLEDMHGDLDIPGFDEEILKTMVADADEVTQKISTYGVLDAEEIQQMQQLPVKNDTLSPPIPTLLTTNEIEESKNDCMDRDLTAVQKFVLCPKCGEKIWL